MVCWNVVVPVETIQMPVSANQKMARFHWPVSLPGLFFFFFHAAHHR